MTTKQQIRLAVLASGSGTNAENLIEYFKGHGQISVSLIVSNNPEAYVLERAKQAGIPYEVITKKGWADKAAVTDIFMTYGIDAVALAGYLLLIPGWFIRMYPEKILNIHPALLPHFGGKGMYGMHVHRAVIASGAQKSGISIHVVNENYDEGEIIFQATLVIQPGETAQSLAKRVQELEHKHYPVVVERYFLA